MTNTKATLAAIISMLSMVSGQAAKAVYAHFMVGIVGGYTVEDWKTDIAQAQESGIDGFALNCAPPRVDNFTSKQLANAYAAADELDFTVFISFDFAYWTTDDTTEITEIVGNYSSHPAQAKYDGGAIVSSFVGDGMNWTVVKNALPEQKIIALPNIQDPDSVQSVDTGLDGAFSWYAWPTDGDNSIIPGPMTTVWDNRFIQNLNGKPYMAPVSPWFFTHYGTKNWVFICEELVTDRWEQMLKLQPELVEIVTWNDYGESHYISSYEPDHSDDGSSAWSKDFPHDAWRSLMKPYIAAYKSGASAPAVDSDGLVYWYRPTPKDVKCSSDALDQPKGVSMLSDMVFVTTLLTEAAELSVTSGNRLPVTVSVAAGIHTTNFTMGVGKQVFTVARGGVTLFTGDGGLEIKDDCTTWNYNAYVGSLTA